MYLFILRQRGREGEREGEKHHCVVASHMPPTGDLACNPHMCPDWELNQPPFGSQASTQSTQPHQPQHGLSFKTLYEECTEFLRRAIFWKMHMLTHSYGICLLHLMSIWCYGKFRLSVPKDTFNLTLNITYYPMLCFLWVPLNYQNLIYNLH